MSGTSLLSPYLADGTEPPKGAAGHLLSKFDALSIPAVASDGQIGRRKLRTLLGEYLDRPATEDELTNVLGELLERKLIESKGPWTDEPVGDTAYRFHMPGDPDVGEEYFAATELGLKLARLCVGTANPMFAFWVFGDKRLEDQIILSCWGMDHSFTLEAAQFFCCCASPGDVAKAADRLIEARLLEPDPNRRSSMRLSYEAQERQKGLQKELREIVFRLGSPKESQAVVPVALRLDHGAKLNLLRTLNEAPLSQSVLIPLLQAMQFSGVTYTNGPHEYGKDIIAWKPDELLHPSWLAVVAKACTLNAKSRLTHDSASTVAEQIRKAFGKPVHVPPTGDPVLVERVWVMNSWAIPPEALSSVEGALDDRWKRRVRWVDGTRLVDLIDCYRPGTWNELLSKEESGAD